MKKILDNPNRRAYFPSQFQGVSCNLKEKVLHQFISNIHVIAKLSTAPTTWMKYFVISPNSPNTRVSHCFSTTYMDGGGGVDLNPTSIGFPLIFSAALFLPFLISIRSFYTCVFSLLSRAPASVCLPTGRSVLSADTIGFLPATKKPPTDPGKSSVGGGSSKLKHLGM